MPCNCDHLEANVTEVKFSRIACLLDELNGKKKINKSHWNGYHPSVYSQTYDKYQTINKEMKNDLVMRLLTLSPEQISKYSLEMQMWWRDYKEENAKFVIQKKKDKMLKQKKLKILSKLTKEEREILGY